MDRQLREQGLIIFNVASQTRILGGFSLTLRQMRKTVIMLLLLAWAGTRALAQSNPLRDSLDVATKALAMAPDSVDLRLKKAAWNIRLEQWSYAKADYDIILSHHPNNVTALFFRAFVNEKLNRYGFARIDYQNFLKLLPGHFEGQIGLILLNEKDKHYTEAMDGANTLIEQYPDSALAYAIRGGIEKERGMYMLAQYDYTQAIIRNPTNTDYILNRAETLLMQGKKAEARRDLDMLVALGTPRGTLLDLYKRAK